MVASRSIIAPNARLLCRTSKKSGRDWREILLQLDDFLEESPLQKANPFICLYYFLPATDKRFSSQKSWVCREVIGPPQLDDNSHFHLYDLSKNRIWSTPWRGNLAELVFAKLWKWEDETRKGLPAPLADTWCLQIGVEEEAFLSMELRHFLG